jgi:hypothetical protein
MKVYSFLSRSGVSKGQRKSCCFKKLDYLHIMFLFYILIPSNFATLNPIILYVKYIKLNVNQTHNVGHWFILSNGVHE